MEKKNTVLLTVIAIATLLVAVVGATFAYFSVNMTNNNADVTVKATTAKASDVFTSTGDGTLSLDITNAVMQEADAGDDVLADSDSGELTVSLNAGSGNASCDYELWLKPDTATASAPYTKTAAAGSLLEFTVAGTDDTTPTAQTFAEVNIPNSLAATGVKLGSYTIADTYDTGLTATTQTWTLSAKFYNLNVDQNLLTDHTFTYSVTVENVVCSNVASN